MEWNLGPPINRRTKPALDRNALSGEVGLSIVAIIPAYDPPELLIGLMRELRRRAPWPVIVIDDGLDLG